MLCPLQGRFQQAHDDYLRVYALRKQPLAALVRKPPEVQALLYTTTHIGQPASDHPLCVPLLRTSLLDAMSPLLWPVCVCGMMSIIAVIS